MSKPRCASQNIDIEIIFHDELPEIQLNDKKLEEAFMNFVSNAIEAMPDGGKLLVEASVNEENNLRITFTDTGCGINNEDMDKIFEPFFTTKDDGTGLGLSLAYHVINSHSGSLSIDSKQNSGTKVEIILPANKSNVLQNI
jgi:signal transduction histidine kinase